MNTPEFWQRLDELVRTGTVVIDRPAGSRHPRYPEFAYPLDKRDTELKLLLNCTPDEACRILATHNVGRQSAILIARPT